MKAIFFALAAIVTVATAAVPVTRKHQQLLGAEECTWGPSYWCKNLTSSARCGATKHCITKHWLNRNVPEDNDSVCDICKQMVQQARDQLTSNATQEDLKNVFETSCKLMLIKPVIEVCDKLVDEFVPELVETLSSQMNPSVVCSVSGLCNSKEIDRLIAEHEASKITIKKASVVSLENDELEPDSCTGCFTIATHLTDKFKKQSKDDLLNKLFSICGQMGSFSDACMSLAITHFDSIHTRLDEDLTPNNICHFSGQCVGNYHKHENSSAPEVEIRPLSTVGIVEINDDLPCKLCEQLVGHLRDLLVANTTEIEFKQVLEGMCKQTKSFSTECKSLVDEYYTIIYESLTHNLNSNAICTMAGICPSPGVKNIAATPFMPLLPVENIHKNHQIISDIKHKNLGEHGSGIKKTEAEEMQLPYERYEGAFPALLMPNMDNKGQETCAFCEYLLHFVQQMITDPKIDDDFKNILGKVCKKLPESIQGTCDEFLQTYEDAIVALLAQSIDPSVVCPTMHVCPSIDAMNMWEKIPKDLMLHSDVKEKPSCPLCLLAVSELEKVIKNDKTEENIEHALDKLCTHLPKDLNEQCTSLIKGYSKELVEMLIADLSPEEICVYAKLCDPTKNAGPSVELFPLDKDGEIMTNEIPNYPVDVKKNIKDDGKCVACEFVMQYVEKAMKNKSTKDEIEHIVHNICNYMPKTVSKSCNNFVNQYADLVIDMLSSEVSPKEVCTLLGLCQAAVQRMINSIDECALCQAMISSIDTALTNPKVDHVIEEIVGDACKYIAPSKQGKCTMMLEVYEQSIINLLKSGIDTKKICGKLTLCSSGDFFAMSNSLFRDRRFDANIPTKYCTWGNKYVCSNEKIAAECKYTEYCKKNVWNKSPALDTL